MQARLVYFHRYNNASLASGAMGDTESPWQIRDSEGLGIPLSVSTLQTILPALNDVDSGVHEFLADMLNEGGTWEAWYLLALGSLVRFCADLGCRRLYSIGKTLKTRSEESVAIILVSEHDTAPITKS